MIVAELLVVANSQIHSLKASGELVTHMAKKYTYRVCTDESRTSPPHLQSWNEGNVEDYTLMTVIKIIFWF